MKYNNTHKITTTIQKITTIQKTKSTTITTRPLKSSQQYTRKITILPNEQKVIIQSKA
jgi:hypothetical protein